MAVAAQIHFAGRSKLVRSGQREPGCAVVKRGCQKGDGVVAIGAVCSRKRCACRRVHRIIRALPSAAVVGIQMALGVAAVRRLNGQRRVVPHMALIATCHLARWSSLV